MIDRHPRVIIRCADVADVRETVLLARQEFLTVAQGTISDAADQNR
jgi:hypothetical protein